MEAALSRWQKEMIRKKKGKNKVSSSKEQKVIGVSVCHQVDGSSRSKYTPTMNTVVLPSWISEHLGVTFSKTSLNVGLSLAA